MTIKQTNFILLASILSFFVVTGCNQQPNGMKADIFSANTYTQQNYETIDVMRGEKSLYDKAYDGAKKYFAPESPVRGAVISANLKNKEELAGFFDRLQKSQKYQTIVVLTPGKINPENSGPSDPKRFLGSTSDYALKTPFGILQPSEEILQKISENPKILSIDKGKMLQEIWTPGVIAPFVAKSFHGAKFMPIFVDEKAVGNDTKDLADLLDAALPQDSLVIALAVSQTSQDEAVAEFQLEFTQSVLENFDATKLDELPLKNSAAVDVLQKYLTKRKALRLQNQYMDASSGSFISFAMEGSLYPSRNVYITAFGDLMFDRLVRSLMDNHSLDYPLEKMDDTYLKNNDILVANLEGPVVKKRVNTSKAIAFRFNPDIAEILKKYHFDALSEANNHAADMGWNGFNETYENLASTGIKIFGNPRELEDRSVAKFDIQGKKIAFLGLEEVVYKIDDKKTIEKIQQLTTEGYKVIPFMHWGIEYQHKPNARQQELAHKFIDAGAVAVIGCHPHVVQTFEIYKNRPVFYSLGNAIFDQYFSQDTQEGLSISMMIADDQLQIYFFPIKIDRSQFRLMTPEERTKFLEKFASWGEYTSEEERQDILKGKITIKI